MAAAVWGVSQLQRSDDDRTFDRSTAAQTMLTGMLDQETALRGFALTRQVSFLTPYARGRNHFDRAAETARRVATDGDERRALAAQVRVGRHWSELADGEVALLRNSPGTPYSRTRSFIRKELFDEFRALNTRFQRAAAHDRANVKGRAGIIAASVILLLALLFGGVGYVAIERQARRERKRRVEAHSYRETQAEFAETMQMMRQESDAYGLVKRHLERSLDGTEVVVLNRNNSVSRLMAATPIPEDSELALKLVDAEPDSCLAVRLAREYRQGAGESPLMECGLCGKSAAEVTCVPSLVSGEVIGSVLVRAGEPLAEEDRMRVADTVTQSAPVLANLRNLAVAEMRASTDALTGLPNTRSCQDTLKRMLAHAGRTVTPLSVVVFDLDHFKQINDRFGHGAGDDVLAAVGEVVTVTLRASDFAGRHGGEEFLALLPDTDRDGAMKAAEKLRQAIELIDVPQVEREISASFGVATYPFDAVDGDGLQRIADRALYAAKDAGRNLVRAAQPPG